MLFLVKLIEGLSLASNVDENITLNKINENFSSQILSYEVNIFNYYEIEY